MKKIVALSLLLSVLLINNPSFATTKSTSHKATVKHCKVSRKSHDSHGRNGKVTPKSIGAGALSLLIWPGIGQLMNDGNNTEKAAVHAVLGLTGVFRFWSCYDGIVNRKGGVWENRI